MSLNPLYELKRHLEDEAKPLTKRLCLAKNIVHSPYFPTAPKERIIGEWLETLTKDNKLASAELQRVLDWSVIDDLTGELKNKLIEIVSQYVHQNVLQQTDIKYLIAFLENSKISTQLSHQIDNYLSISIILLQCLRNEEELNIPLSQKLLNNFVKYYKESKKKLEFITKFLDGANLETVFSYLETECSNTVIEICRTILFPISKKTFFISYLQTLIRKDNLEELIAEKGDNIQSVIKIMSVFFEFPKHRTDKDPNFLQNFINVFVSCFHAESQIIYAFYIMVANALDMKQDYITPSMNMTPIIFENNDEKIKRNLFFNMLNIVLQNEVEINVRLTDTFGEKVSKVEIKKNFMSFLQAVMMGQLKLEGKADKTTLQIIKTILKLDPVLIEQKMDEILPPIMTAKKNANILQSYKDMLSCLLEILFKLSHGTSFLTQILPTVKIFLDASNPEQLELAQRIKEHKECGLDCKKLESKLITANDLFPQECVELYGKLTTDLMFRQNKELLELLQKDFEEHCLTMLEDGFVSPSIGTLTEVLSAILSSFLRHSKMADHTVPQHIGEDFWTLFTKFEHNCLKKFGQCVLKFENNPSLLLSFLNLCLSYSQLKLLNIKYSNHKLDVKLLDTREVFDLSILLPSISKDEWVTLAAKIEEDAAVLVLDNLLVLKTMATEILSIVSHQDASQALYDIKSHIIKQININPSILDHKYIPRILFSNLDQTQYKMLAKILVKLFLNDHSTEILCDVAILNNKFLLNALVLEVTRNITKCLGNCESLTKALNKIGFDIIVFAKENTIVEYFNNISLIDCQETKLKKCLDLVKLLRIPHLEENYQLTAIFVLLALKKNCQSKKIKKSVDCVLQNIFELCQHSPDLYRVFPVDYIFSFQDMTILELLTIKLKCTNQLIVIKSIMESAVKRVRWESDLVKDIVKLLLFQRGSIIEGSIQSFSDMSFQITCLILPLIVKQKKAITTSAYRSILADLQEQLHKILLDTFKNIDFNDSLFTKTGNTEDSVVESDNMTALNAMPAYTLTLSRYCETTDAREIKNLDCLWSGLEFFIQNAINSIKETETKNQYIDNSLQLLNVTLRHVKKLEAHDIFNEKDKLFTDIWKSIAVRLLMIFQDGGIKKCGYIEDLGVTLKFICELVSVEKFANIYLRDLANLVVLKKPIQIIKDDSKSVLTSHIVSKYLWIQCLKANTAGPKCGAMTKLIYQISRNLTSWIRQHYDSVHCVASKKRKFAIYKEEESLKIVKVDDCICDILRVDLDTLSEVIFAGKKITIDYKFLDSIFELQHLVHYILGFNATHLKCEISWQGFFTLYEGCVAILNSLLVSREEILEDRWPCYMQCYRALSFTLCERATTHVQLETKIEEKLAELAHSLEKLTQSISKRKKQVSRISAYTVADICTSLEKYAPSRTVRQHLENSVALLLQTSDSSYSMAFLKRALAGSVGQMTLTNSYSMYKRYHKYTGNS